MKLQPGFTVPHALFRVAHKQDEKFPSSDTDIRGQRDMIVGSSPLSMGEEPKRSKKRQLDFLEAFTNLCMCDPSRQTRQGPASLPSKKRIIYPIAKYPGRLNSPKLVQQRRKSVAESQTFRPLSIPS